MVSRCPVSRCQVSRFQTPPLGMVKRNGAIHVSRVNFSGYVGHVTILVYCVLFGSRVRNRVRVRFSV